MTWSLLSDPDIARDSVSRNLFDTVQNMNLAHATFTECLLPYQLQGRKLTKLNPWKTIALGKALLTKFFDTVGKMNLAHVTPRKCHLPEQVLPHIRPTGLPVIDSMRLTKVPADIPMHGIVRQNLWHVTDVHWSRSSRRDLSCQGHNRNISRHEFHYTRGKSMCVTWRNFKFTTPHTLIRMTGTPFYSSDYNWFPFHGRSHKIQGPSEQNDLVTLPGFVSTNFR